MYTLMIVDDEYQARNGLRDLIDWTGLGISVVGDAEDGDVALPLLSQLRPDILLTDVRMNRMDGLDLARQAKAVLPGLEIVFISGYSDSEYLRDALRVEAHDYLYKPVRIGELENLLRALVKKLDDRAGARRQMERAYRLLENSRPLLVERFLSSWINGMLQDAETVKARMELLDLSIPEGSGLVAAALQPEWPSFPSDGQAEAYLILLQDEIRDAFARAFICVQGTGILALIPVHADTEVQAMRERLESILDHTRGVADAGLLIGVSRWHADWFDVPEAAREAQRSLERQLSREESMLYEDEDSADPEAAEPYAVDDGVMERYLVTGNFEALWQGMEAVLSGADPGPSGLERARKILMSCALRADLVMARRGLPGIDALTFCRQALAHTSLSPAKGALRDALQDACRRIRHQQDGAYSATVERVLEIIHTRYAQRLSMEVLADEVHYSPAHLSTLFRQETGTTIGDSLFRTRLAAAMDMLRTTRAPVSQIAQQSGYTDVQYFSRVFKRHTGVTPLEYRRRAQT